MKLTSICVSLSLLYVNQIVKAGITEAQLKANIKLVRNVCQPRTQVSDDNIEKLFNGNWNIDYRAMCYLHCVLRTIKIINNRNNNFNLEMAVKLAKKRLPDKRIAPFISSANKCKNSAKTLNDKCIAAFEISKCLYESDPQNYFIN